MPTYGELLSDYRWKAKRLEIIHRDENKCQFCLNKDFIETYTSGKFFTKVATSFFFESFRKEWIILFDDTLTEEIKRARLLFENFKTYSHNLAFYHNIAQNDNIVIALKSSPIPDSSLINKFIITINDIKDYNNLGDFLKSPEVASQKIRWKTKILVISQQTYSEKEYWKEAKWDYIYGLNVHHKCYRKNKNPWEYNNDDLITACPICHDNIHSKIKIPEYSEMDELIRYLTPCSRCHGVGWFPEFLHVQEGVCFRCDGAQYDELISK